MYAAIKDSKLPPLMPVIHTDNKENRIFQAACRLIRDGIIIEDLCNQRWFANVINYSPHSLKTAGLDDAADSLAGCCHKLGLVLGVIKW